MTTTNLREKINVLNTLLQQADLESFQLGLTIECANESTGDAQIDAQLKSHAQNAAAQLVAVKRRIAVCQDALAPLQAELDATQGN